ncbi:hypothetical protein AGLY_012826 [Aphis glycines]|uniref:Envelope fusion protein n=1 Tax=Aphis glycines TaxID=307491 RepID=A0A6G0TAC2_APHGL|nr:hypothetical protein AGLY_012826 [Aphis glycines]
MVIFIFASSLLVERASRREHLSTSREVDVADAARTIDERLGMLEDAVRSLSAEFALFTLNHVLKNQELTGQAPTKRAPPIHTSELTRTVPKSWCYYHVRFGKDARKCSSDLCTFSPKISTENKTFNKLYTSDKPEKQPSINDSDQRNHHQVFNLTAFKNQQGIYYESHGVARLSHVSWELVISLDVQLLISKYHVIMAHYQATTTICEKMKNRLGNVEIEEICSLFIQRFSRATLPYLNEIEANHISIMLAMNNDDNRIRRGLGQTFRRMANVLYGLCSKIDVEFIINQITELNRSKVPSKSNIPEKIRFLQAEVNHSTQQLELQQQKVEQNLQYLQAQANLNIQNLNKLAFRTKVLEQSLLFELVLSKYAYETQNLISIINSALDGKMPTSVFTPQHIIKELLEIKVDLPIGNTFPVEVNIESLNEILRISEKNIFFKDNYLIYVIEISLITSEEYSIYHPIPLPIPHSEQTIFLVDPEIDYLGVSRDNENFIALDNVKWEECITLKPYKVCRGNQHVQHCAESDVCVVSLLVNNQFNPDHCKVKIVSLKAPIWHQLVQTNSWIYYTQREVSTITCTNPTENSKIEIEGVGRITIPPFCKINLRNSILFSNNKASRDIRSDIIPKNSKNEPLHTLADIVKTIIPQNLTNKILIQNLNQLTNKAVELNELSHTLAEPSLIFNINIHVIVIYIIVILTILTTSILSFSLRKNVTKIYNPEIPEA